MRKILIICSIALLALFVGIGYRNHKKQPDEIWYLGKVMINNEVWYVSLLNRTFLKNQPNGKPDVRVLNVVVRNTAGRIFADGKINNDDWQISYIDNALAQTLPQDYCYICLITNVVTLIYQKSFRINNPQDTWKASSPNEIWQSVFVHAKLANP